MQDADVRMTQCRNCSGFLCRLNVFFDNDDNFTCEYVSRRLGNTVSADEIALFFAGIEDGPGQALVLVPGGKPMILRRAHYFEDEHFSRLFDRPAEGA